MLLVDKNNFNCWYDLVFHSLFCRSRREKISGILGTGSSQLRNKILLAITRQNLYALLLGVVEFTDSGPGGFQFKMYFL